MTARENLVPRSDAESIDPAQERRALARLQSKLFGTCDAPLRVGRYELGRRIGAGGMGIVYEAEDPSLDRRVAIKLVRGRSPTALHDTIVEARALAAISEPNVVTVFDAGFVELDDAERTVFIAMELLEGPTLSAWLDGTHRWQDVLQQFVAVGRGLAAAHRRGVVHGDFKPSNVLFGRGGTPFVCDFGLARMLDDPFSETEEQLRGAAATRTLRGTLGYLAPELLSGSQPTVFSDQFAFCVTLHRALVAAGRGEPLRAAPLIAGGLSPLPRTIPPAIEAALRRGFDPDPARRFASMEQLLAALHRAAGAPWSRRASPWLLAVALVAAIAVPGSRASFERSEATVGDEATKTVAAIEDVFAASMQARAHLRVADDMYKRGSWDASLAAAQTAYQAALDVQHFDVAALAASRAMIAAHELGDIDWQRWQRHTETALQQTEALRPRVHLAARLSGVFERDARFPEALQQAERAIEGTRALARSGDADPQLEILARHVLGIALWRVGRLDEAEAVLRAALADHEQLVGVRAPVLAALRHQLALVLGAKGQHAESLALAELNYEVERDALPPGHPDHIAGLIELAAVKRMLGRYEDAQADLARADAELRPNTSGLARAALLIARANLSMNSGRIDEAEAPLIRALTVLDSEGEAGWHPRLTVLLNLTELYRMHGDRERAVHQLRTAIDVMCEHVSAAECVEAKAELDAAAADGDLERISAAVAKVQGLGPRA